MRRPQKADGMYKDVPSCYEYFILRIEDQATAISTEKTEKLTLEKLFSINSCGRDVTNVRNGDKLTMTNGVI